MDSCLEGLNEVCGKQIDPYQWQQTSPSNGLEFNFMAIGAHEQIISEDIELYFIRDPIEIDWDKIECPMGYIIPCR
jgi:hypothetical protein